MGNRFRVALIGSRVLHENPSLSLDVDYMHKVCRLLAHCDFQYTSGLCAKGVDAIAQIEFAAAIRAGSAFNSQVEVYVSDIRQKQKSQLPNKHLAIVMNPSLKKELEILASQACLHWGNCGGYARGQHMRNAHQILGYNLKNPVDCVITWCSLNSNGTPKGGTATALKIANDYNIPVFNFNTSDKARLWGSFLELLSWKRGLNGDFMLNNLVRNREILNEMGVDLWIPRDLKVDKINSGVKSESVPQNQGFNNGDEKIEDHEIRNPQPTNITNFKGLLIKFEKSTILIDLTNATDIDLDFTNKIAASMPSEIMKIEIPNALIPICSNEVVNRFLTGLIKIEGLSKTKILIGDIHVSSFFDLKIKNLNELQSNKILKKELWSKMK